MIPNRLGMCPGCIGRGTSATGSSGQLLTDPETTLPPLIVAPHACVEAVVDAEAALIGLFVQWYAHQRVYLNEYARNKVLIMV